METELHPGLTIRLFREQKCFGPGVAELLRRVDVHRSLRAAAQSMEMAYSKAWTIIKNAENGLGFRLLETQTGGRRGGGASLTDEARRLLAAYERFCDRVNAFSAAAFAEEFAFLDE